MRIFSFVYGEAQRNGSEILAWKSNSDRGESFFKGCFSVAIGITSVSTFGWLILRLLVVVGGPVQTWCLAELPSSDRKTRWHSHIFVIGFLDPVAQPGSVVEIVRAGFRGTDPVLTAILTFLVDPLEIRSSTQFCSIQLADLCTQQHFVRR